MTDEQLIRAAILDVVDGKLWRFYADEAIESDDGAVRVSPMPQETVNLNRLDFCDAVVARIQQLRQMDNTAEANHPR